MSTELKSIKCRKETEFGNKESEIRLTRFSGWGEWYYGTDEHRPRCRP